MLRHRFTAAITLAVFTFVATGCASTVLINSSPDGAEVFIDGQSIGYTPTSYTDSGIVFSNRQVEVHLDGYEVHRATIRRDAEINVGALLGGIFCLWPLFLWALDYPSQVNYQLRPLYGEMEMPPALKVEESSVEVALEVQAE